MKFALCAAALSVSFVGATGCTDNKKVDPKPAEGQTIDPRIKSAETGTGGGGAKPQQNNTQGVVKDD